MTKVYISPRFRKEDKGDGGIRRVVEAQVKHLGKFDIEIVSSTRKADVINCHGTDLVATPGQPMVYSNHGMMWSRYDWGDWAHDINKGVVNAMISAVAHTAPSEWVANSLRRNFCVYPEVVYHGVDVEDWEVKEVPGNFVLWNKARSDDVSNPDEMDMIARRLPDVPFVSTFGTPAPNVQLVGRLPFLQMKDLIMSSGIHLATARETFGIGILESMASGVPIAGWDCGGMGEIVQHGVTGYLAPWGDFDALAECVVKCLEERDELGKNARLDVEERWGWEHRIKQYADIFHYVHDYFNVEQRPKVSVIVTCFNLGKYLPDALRSLEIQTFKDWEAIIVDDHSPDDTALIAKSFAKKDPRFKYVKTPENLGLSGARNYGVSVSKGRYVIPLDADDILEENALQILSAALDSDNATHIAYGHLVVASDDLSNPKRNKWPTAEFNWVEQMAHLNQLTYASMIRRDVFERFGGYRVRDWRAEDASMWCRMTSFGARAKKVTERPTLIYRNRSDSKSKGEPSDGDWRAWFPWHVPGAHNARAGHTALRKGKRPDPLLVPMGAQGDPPNGKAWHAHDYSYPCVTVVIPVGPGHEDVVIDAVESVMAQTYPDWEVIVVNDTGKEWVRGGLNCPLAGAPYAKVISTGGTKGAGHARNMGAQHARSPLLYWLDADDILLPTCLSKSVAVYEDCNAIVYSDALYYTGKDEKLKEQKNDAFVAGAVLKRMQHAVNALVPKSVHDEIGGFDETLRGWEDWDYYIALQATGIPSTHIPEPLFIYKVWGGQRRDLSMMMKDDLLEYVKEKWSDYYSGDKKMACRKCPGRKSKPPKPKSLLQSSGNFQRPAPEIDAAVTMVEVRYIGESKGALTFRGRETKTKYRFDNTGRAVKFVHRPDVDHLLRLTSQGKPLFELATYQASPDDTTADQFVNMPER